MIDAVAAIPGVESVGLIDWAPLVSGGNVDSLVFTDATTDLRQSNAAAESYLFGVSPDYFQAAHTALLSGQNFHVARR